LSRGAAWASMICLYVNGLTQNLGVGSRMDIILIEPQFGISTLVVHSSLTHFLGELQCVATIANYDLLPEVTEVHRRAVELR
jgi:hypothetical protein